MLTYTHPRASWLGSERWAPGSPAFDWDPVDLLVIHWPGHDGVPDGDPGEYADRLPVYLRSMQRDYRDRRGYNLGYNAAFDFLGGSWEGRGEAFKCAANAGINERAFALLLMTDLDGRYTQQMVNSVRAFVAQVRKIKPTIKTIGHQQGREYNPKATATACPGPLLELVRSGVFDVPPVQVPPPNPTGPTTGTYTVQKGDGWFAIARRLGVETGPLLEVNKATLQTMLHPGQVLKVPGTATQPDTQPDWAALGATFGTPDRNSAPVFGQVHPNITWLQAVLCSMLTLPAGGSRPIFPPTWVGTDRVSASAPAITNMYGIGTRAALAYWQDKNGLHGASWYDTMTRMAQVRGR